MKTNNTQFYIQFDKDYFISNHILVSKDINLQITTPPYKVWYKLLLQYVTLNLYKAPIQYKCKVINTE